MIRRALQDSLIYAIAAVLSRSLMIIQVPLFSAFLAPHQFGLLDIIGIAVNLINLTVAFEISQAVAIYYSESSSQKEKVAYASSSLWFTLACYGVFTALAWPFAEELFGLLLGSRAQPELAEIFLLSSFANALFLLTQNQLRWMLRSYDYLFASLVHGITNIGFSVIFVYQFSLGVQGMLYAQLVSALIAAAVCVYFAREVFKFVLDFACLKKMLAFSLPLVPSSISVFLSLYVDRLCIKSFLGMHEVGLYGVAYRFASVVGVIIIGFSRAFTPLIYKNSKEESTPRHIAALFKFYTYISLGMILFLGLFSNEIMRFLASEEYYSAHSLIPAVAAALVIANIYIFAPGLALMKRTKVIATISIITALINLALNLILIPWMGIFGSAYATLLSAAFSSYLWLHYGHKLYRVPFDWLRIAAASTLVFAVILLNYILLPSSGISLAALRGLVFVIMALACILILGTKEEFVKLLTMFRLSRSKTSA